jgi:hypothetical protein
MYSFILGENTVIALKYNHHVVHIYHIFVKVLAISVLAFTAMPPYWDFTDWAMYVTTKLTTLKMETRENKWKTVDSRCMCRLFQALVSYA